MYLKYSSLKTFTFALLLIGTGSYEKNKSEKLNVGHMGAWYNPDERPYNIWDTGRLFCNLNTVEKNVCPPWASPSKKGVILKESFLAQISLLDLLSWLHQWRQVYFRLGLSIFVSPQGGTIILIFKCSFKHAKVLLDISVVDVNSVKRSDQANRLVTFD